MRAFARTANLDSLSAFHYPAYVRIWLGAFVSNVGTWIQTVAVGVWVTETTGKAGWTGTIAALSYLPSVALGPLGGVLADRYDRRRVVAVLTLVQALLAAVLAALAVIGHLPLLPVAVLTFLNGCASALVAPAYNAFLVEIVQPEDVLSAVSLSSANFNLARMVGPMLAAGALAAGGITLAFVANTLSFFAVLVALASMGPAKREVPARSEGFWQAIATGWRVARVDPGIRLSLTLVLAVSILVAPFIGLMPAFAINGFDRGAAGASLLVASQGVGALLFAFAANAVASRWGVRKLYARALLVLAPVAAAYWLAPRFGLALALASLLGGVYLWTLTAASTTCMTRVSRDLQARTNSFYNMTLSGGYSLGMMLQGWLADRAGLRLVPAVAAGLLFVIVAWLHRTGAFEAIDAPSAFGGVREGTAGRDSHDGQRSA